jgi:hypothetical protein
LEDFAEKIYDEVKADVLPFESWERVAGEGAAAFAAFCVFRDFGAGRSIVKAVASAVSDERARAKRYRVWRNWASRFQWSKRAADYDAHLDRIVQAERRKTIEAREEAYREVTGKMLSVVSRRLDVMNDDELKQELVGEWVKTAVGTEREVLGVSKSADDAGENGQPALNFAGEFKGL